MTSFNTTSHATPEEEELAAIARFDLAISTAFTKQVMNLLNDVYFRARLVGFEAWDERNNPAAPLIYLSNHSGMALPWDAVSFVAMLFRRFDYEYDKSLRTLITPFFTRVGLLAIYQVPEILTRSGGVEATFQNFESAMRLRRGNVLVYPEGLRGIGKGFDRRYRLQRVSTSVVRMALKYQTDLIHFATVNGEYIHPFAYRSEWLNRVGKRLLGIPFLPLTALLPFILLQPWVFYLAFPANLTFVRKSRIRWQELSQEPFDSLDETSILAIRDRVQDQMQRELTEAENTYGKSPFGWASFWRQLRRHWKLLPIFLPIGWPLLFWEFQRQFVQDPDPDKKLELRPSSLFAILWRQPWLIAYYLPIVGWIPILYWSSKLGSGRERRV